jgi:hypothetical protein
LLTSTKLLGGFKGFKLPDDKDKKLSNKKPKLDIMDKLRMSLNKSLTSNKPEKITRDKQKESYVDFSLRMLERLDNELNDHMDEIKQDQDKENAYKE